MTMTIPVHDHRLPINALSNDLVVEQVKNGVARFRYTTIDRVFALDKKSLEERIKNLEERGLFANVEYAALAEINRQERETA